MKIGVFQKKQQYIFRILILCSRLCGFQLQWQKRCCHCLYAEFGSWGWRSWVWGPGGVEDLWTWWEKDLSLGCTGQVRGETEAADSLCCPWREQLEEEKESSLFVTPSFKSQFLNSLGYRHLKSSDVHDYNLYSRREVCCSLQNVKEKKKCSLCSLWLTNIVDVITQRQSCKVCDI